MSGDIILQQDALISFTTRGGPFDCAISEHGDRDGLEVLGRLHLPDGLVVEDVATIEGIGDGGLTSYDLKVGDTDGTPTYGMIQIGNASIGRTSFKGGNMDADGAVVFRNLGGPVTGEIEFIFSESAANTARFVIPKSGVGNATYNPRSMLLAGPAPNNTDFVKVSYWQANGIFHNLVCDTSGFGADLGVQNDLEVEGDIFVDSIKESTPGASITVGNKVNFTGTDRGVITGATNSLKSVRVELAGVVYRLALYVDA